MPELETSKGEKESHEDLYEIGKKMGLKKEHLDAALLLAGKPRLMLGARQILLHDQDFIRAFQYMESYQYGRGNIDGAYDARLGLINEVASVGQYNPVYRLDSDQVGEVNSLREDIRFVEDFLIAFQTKRIVGHGAEITAMRQFYREKDFNGNTNPYNVLDHIRREYRRKVDRLMVRVKVALEPLASSRRGPGREQAPEPQSEPQTDVGSLALGAVAGVRSPREPRAGEQ